MSNLILYSAPKWKSLLSNASFIYDGIETGNKKSEIFSYIGRIKTDNIFTPIEISLKFAQQYPTNNVNSSIEFISKSPAQTFAWIKSSSGAVVKNAISINEVNNWPFYIGRIKVNGNFFIGKVLPSVGLKYTDKYKIEKIVKLYEVLTCESMVNEKLDGGCK